MPSIGLGGEELEAVATIFGHGGDLQLQVTGGKRQEKAEVRWFLVPAACCLKLL